MPRLLRLLKFTLPVRFPAQEHSDDCSADQCSTVPGLPFGGHGPSGYGSYHGVAGFETFSHSRSYASVPRALEAALSLRYPPFTPQRTRLLGAVQRPEGVYPGALRLRKARRAAVAALMLALLMAWPRARNLLINVTRFVPQVARRALERIHSS